MVCLSDLSVNKETPGVRVTESDHFSRLLIKLWVVWVVKISSLTTWTASKRYLWKSSLCVLFKIILRFLWMKIFIFCFNISFFANYASITLVSDFIFLLKVHWLCSQNNEVHSLALIDDYYNKIALA